MTNIKSSIGLAVAAASLLAAVGCQDASSSIETSNADDATTIYQKNYETIETRGKCSILHWNIESGGNDPELIAEQLFDLGVYSIVALSEVDDHETIVSKYNHRWSDRYKVVLGDTGKSRGDYADDRLLVLYDRHRFKRVESIEMSEVEGIQLNDGRHRSPLLVRFTDRLNGLEFAVIHNHFARGNAELRQSQARGLREWARNKSLPIICIGDLNLDYDFNTQQGNKAFDEMMKDGVFKWIKPDPFVDTNWSDRDGDGKDNYPDSMLDFSFVAGEAKEWDAECNVIVRDGDFPDNEKTSDHRPVELILRIPTQ